MFRRFFLGLKAFVNLNSLSILLGPIVALAATACQTAVAQDFLVAPTRIIFEGGTRAQEVVVMNRGKSANTFRITLENRRIGPDGSLIEATDIQPDDNFAASLLRISTRQVTLNPNESAVVRILLRKPEGLADGEYRSHLVFRGLPSTDSPISTQQVSSTIKIRLVPVFGVSIPLIVRQGSLQGKVNVTGARLEPVVERPTLANIQTDISLTGNRTTFVDLRLIDGRGTLKAPVYLMRGLAVYWPTARRTVTLSLNAEQSAIVRSGNIKVQWQEVDKDGTPIGPNQELAL